MNSSIKKFVYFIALICIAGIYEGCDKAPNYKVYTYPSPVVTGMTPTSGYPNTYVTITGSKFGGLLQAVKVKFGGVQADSIISCTDAQIVVKVPATALTGKVSLSVWTNSIDSIGKFTVLVPPTIKSLSPSAGSPGDVVKVIGKGFGTDLTKLGITFNGTVGTITAAVDTQLTVTVPNNVTSGNIVVKVNGYPVTGPAFVYLVTVQPPVYQYDFENNLNATLGGTALIYTQGAGSPVSYIPGINGQAISLAGYSNPLGGANSGIYNQVLALPTNAAQYNELTVSCWVYAPTLSDWTPIFDFGSTRGNHICLLERASAGWNGAGNNMVGRAIFEKVTGFPSYLETNYITGTTLAATGWHQVAMTFSKSTLTTQIFYDGSLIKTGTLPTGYDLTVYSQLHAYIGANAYGTALESSFAGGIDKFQIYNYVLSANQVYTLFIKK